MVKVSAAVVAGAMRAKRKDATQGYVMAQGQAPVEETAVKVKTVVTVKSVIKVKRVVAAAVAEE